MCGYFFRDRRNILHAFHDRMICFCQTADRGCHLADLLLDLCRILLDLSKALYSFLCHGILLLCTVCKGSDSFTDIL